MNLNKKTAIMCILKIFEKYTDQNHFLTQQDILDKLFGEYDLELERKAVASSIKQLINLGYDINKNPNGGFYLLSREFDESELQFIIDAIYSSRSITSNQAKSLIKKFLSFSSIHNKKNYDYLFKSSEITRNKNNELFLNIELINEAIIKSKQISFSYMFYNETGKLIKKDKIYKVNPFYLINNFGKYYLLCNFDKYDNISIYRLEFITEIVILNNERRKIDEIKEFNDFDIGNFIKNHIYIFGGEIIDAKVLIHDRSAINYIIDWFGDNAKIYKENDLMYAFIKCNQEALFYWLIQYVEYVEVTTPLSLRYRVIETIQIMKKRYE